MEFLFEQPYLPRVVGGFQVFEIVAAVDVDDVKLEILRADLELVGEKMVEDEVCLFQIVPELPPDDERPAAVGQFSFHAAKPERARGVGLDPAPLQLQPFFLVALERR